MAERVGFEPTVPVKVRQFSRLLDSSTLAPLRESYILMFGTGKYQVSIMKHGHFGPQTAILPRYVTFVFEKNPASMSGIPPPKYRM